MKNNYKSQLLLSVALSTTFPCTAMAQPDDELEEIVVLGQSRLPSDISTFPGSVTLLDAQELAEQAAITTDLGRILETLVPGMAPSARDGNNFSQTLRGRKPAFFIDGIPQSAALRGGGRDLRILNTSVLQGVEVVRGSTAIYGLGGAGGIVNYITKKPSAEGFKYFTEVSFSPSLSEFGSDTHEYGLTQSLSGKRGDIDFVGNLSYQSRGLFADADGDLIPPDPNGQTGIADMDEITLFAKVGLEITPTVRLELMGLNYDAEVDTDYTVGQGDFANGIKSVAVDKEQDNLQLGPFRFDFIGEEDPASENTVIATTLIVDDLAGSSVRLQGFHQELDLVWRHLDFIVPGLAGFPGDSQLTTNSAKYGARVDIRTPLQVDVLDNAFVLWGTDYVVDDTHERLVDGRDRSKAEQTSLSFFAQLQLDINEHWHVSGGVRYDDFELDIADIQSIDLFVEDLFHPVTGATLDYDNVAGNLGVVYDFNDALSLSVAWSSGFSIGNVLRTVGALRPQTPSAGPVSFSVADLGQLTEAVEVDSYEISLRYAGDDHMGSVTVFRNESDLGATFDPISLELERAPERVWGIELAGEAQFTDALKVGASYTRMDSEIDADDDGRYESELDFSRVPPPLLVGYLETALLRNWTARVQASKIFDEERFDAPFGNFQRDIDGYTLADLLVSGPVLGGNLSIGVENLFNKQYTPIATLLGCSDDPGTQVFCNVAGPGIRATLRFSREY